MFLKEIKTFLVECLVQIQEVFEILKKDYKREVSLTDVQFFVLVLCKEILNSKHILEMNVFTQEIIPRGNFVGGI